MEHLTNIIIHLKCTLKVLTQSSLDFLTWLIMASHCKTWSEIGINRLVIQTHATLERKRLEVDSYGDQLIHIQAIFIPSSDNKILKKFKASTK